MTTVFGLRHPELDFAAIVADRQTTMLDGTGMPAGKYLGRKLWRSKNDNYCFGHSGNRDEELGVFVEELTNEGFDMEKIISEGYFPELRDLNMDRMGKKIPDPQQTSGIIMLTRYDKQPKLYTCFPLGSVEERAWTTMGSGDQKINEYMGALKILGEAKNYLVDSEPMDSDDIIRIGLEAVRRSQNQDIYSHGLDMMICTPEGISDHYDDLEDNFGERLKNIQDKYNKKK